MIYLFSPKSAGTTDLMNIVTGEKAHFSLFMLKKALNTNTFEQKMFKMFGKQCVTQIYHNESSFTMSSMFLGNVDNDTRQ